MRFILTLALGLGLSGCFAHSKQDKRLAEIRRSLGADFMGKQRWRDGLEELQRAKAYDDTNPEVRYSLAFCLLYGFKRAKEAEQELRAAIRLNPSYSEAYNLLGIALNEQNRRDEAIAAFEKALGNMLYRTPFFASQNLAQTLVLMGKEEEGMKRLRLAIKGNPNLCGAYLTLLSLAEKRGATDVLKSYDPEFLSRCVRNDLASERLPAELRRAAYIRAIARAKSERNHKEQQALARECREKAPRRDHEPGPGCPGPQGNEDFGGRGGR